MTVQKIMLADGPKKNAHGQLLCEIDQCRNLAHAVVDHSWGASLECRKHARESMAGESKEAKAIRRAAKGAGF